MSTEFRNDNDVNFGQLGLTSSLTGITLTQTIYNSVTGQTTSTMYVPTALNYVLGSAMSGTLRGASYQTYTNGILSLTTQSTRIVEISLVPVGGGAYIDWGGININPAPIAEFRLLRGPSTFIADVIFQNQLLGLSTTAFLFRSPPSTISFLDLTPLSGAATYILQAETDGLSTTITFNQTALFVRQI